MRQPPSLTSRRLRLFLGWTSVVGLAAAIGTQASCARLKPPSDSVPGQTSNADGGVQVYPTSTRDLDDTNEPPDTVVDGGLPTVTKAACTDDFTRQLSHTPAILPDGGFLDISSAKGYTADPTVAQSVATTLSGGMTNLSVYANQMRGNPPNGANDIYRTEDDTNTNVKGLLFRDGPRGVNIDSPTFLGPYSSSHVLAEGPTPYATTFPVSSARAATWDLDLESRIGEDIGDEILTSENTMTISPCVNILRNPAWGRSQETYGEDSFALGRMGSAFVHGAQQYVPACAKHFAANNIEFGRQNQIAIMDSQTLHEIYGRHFEMIVQEAGVACVMASYNSIQLTDGPDTAAYKDAINPLLLKGILRETFGFKGFIMSDFWAMPPFQEQGLPASTYAGYALQGVQAQLDLEMPFELNYVNLEAIGQQTPSLVSQLQASATYIVEQKERFDVADPNSTSPGLRKPETTLQTGFGITGNDKHIGDAELQAEEAMVLLKNEPLSAVGSADDGGDMSTPPSGEGGSGDKPVLPIDTTTVHKIAVIGAVVPWQITYPVTHSTWNFATDIRVGDLGSSRVNPEPDKTVGPYAGIKGAATKYGIDVTQGTTAQDVGDADFVVVMAGMTPQDEGEDYTGASDRADQNGSPNYSLDGKLMALEGMSPIQDPLIEAVAALHKPMVVVLEGGSAMNMPWLDRVPAMVMAWYPGQQGGTALAKLLFGEAVFNGKLPITWPKSEADEPIFNTGPAQMGNTKMGYYLGYRWFDQQNITPLFAFGSGKTYTTFSYDFIGVPCSTVTHHGVVDVQVAVKNTGNVAANETSFLFVSLPPNPAVQRAAKDLKGFHRTKEPIQPGQTVLFTIRLRVADLKYWNSSANPPGWAIDNGAVQIMVGPSADNLPLKEMITVTQ